MCEHPSRRSFISGDCDATRSLLPWRRFITSLNDNDQASFSGNENHDDAPLLTATRHYFQR
ncbi:hypothetical protein M6B38_198065 [Iris pallida]|uniref:Uncharacterized protein n=1 Tax=Iris pallida TaxID=29817 RepID=A0AAX6EBZ2_IRIPA|nr:hypothetical protein M6B38_198065 [Iris pallida]